MWDKVRPPGRACQRAGRALRWPGVSSVTRVSEAFAIAREWATGLGLPDGHPLAEPSAYGARTWANFIPCRLDKSPLVREWRHLSAAGVKSPRLTSHEIWQMERRAGREDRPAAYAILPGSAGLVIVDVDDPAMVDALVELYGDTPIRTHTPSGGTHLYYLAPEDPESPDGIAAVVSRTWVRGPKTYDVKAAGAMAHMPGGESLSGLYRASVDTYGLERGELRAALPVFPVERYREDWSHHHEGADWSPQGDRADDFVLGPAHPLADGRTAADLWDDAIELIGQAREGERHDKTRRLALNLGDRGCSEEQAIEILREWNAANAPPATQDEVERWAREAYRSRRSALGCRAWPHLEAAAEEDEGDAPPTEVTTPAPRAISTSTVPDLDIDDLLGDVPGAPEHCRAVAGVLNILPDMPAIFALTFASAAIAGRAMLRTRLGLLPLHLHQIVEARPGDGKSICLARMGRALFREHQERICAAAKRAINVARVERRDLEDARDDRRKLLKSARKDGNALKIARLHDELIDIEQRLDAPLPQEPRYLAGDVNPMGLCVQMIAARFAFVVAGEGSIVLRNFCSAASDGIGGRDQLEPWLCSYSGEELPRTRVGEYKSGGGPQSPTMRAVFLLPLQPGILVPKSEAEAQMLAHLGGRGLFARVMISRPRELSSKDRVPSFSAEEVGRRQAAWEDRLRGLLLDVPGHDHPLAPSEPATLTMSEGAARLLYGYQERMRWGSRPGGDYAEIAAADIAARAGEQAMRVAGVLRLLREGSIRSCEVEEADASRAVRFIEQYALPQARLATERAVFSPVDDDAERVFDLLQKHGGTVTRRALLDSHLKRGWAKQRHERASRLDAAVAHLVERGWVAEVAAGGKAYTVARQRAAA